MSERKSSSPNRYLIRYGSAIGAVAGGFLLRQLLTGYTGPGLATYITFYPAVIFVALLAGLGPGILATVLTALVADYYLLLPQGLFAIRTPSDLVGVILFSANGVLISVVAELYRRTREKTAA